jgi:hypothetical protein
VHVLGPDLDLLGVLLQVTWYFSGFFCSRARFSLKRLYVGQEAEPSRISAMMMRNVVSLIVQTGTGAFCDGEGFFGGCFGTFACTGE